MSQNPLNKGKKINEKTWENKQEKRALNTPKYVNRQLGPLDTTP